MIEKTAVETNKIGKSYSFNLTPEYISSLPQDRRKDFRSVLYQYPKERLDYESFDRLKIFQLFELETTSNHGKKRYYQGDFVLKEEEVNTLYLKTGIDLEELKKVITPKSNISYEEAEALFNGDTKFLITSMTLMSNSYLSLLTNIDSKYINRMGNENIFHFKTPFLFTNSEEIMFFTGRTLLKELNENIEDEYINELINDIDSIIFRFNTGLIGDIIKKYVKRKEEDYFPAGTEGLVRAIKKFDIDRGYKFSTYATHWIRREIILYYYDEYPYIRIPRYMQKTLNNLKKAKEILKNQNGGKPPSLEEAAAYCREKDDSFAKSDKNLKSALKTFNIILSLDEELGDDSKGQSTLYDYIKNKKDDIDDSKGHIENVDRVRKIIKEANLDPRSTKIIEMRYGFLLDWNNTRKSYYTLGEIANFYGISRERVRQILVKGLKRLRVVSQHIEE